MANSTLLQPTTYALVDTGLTGDSNTAPTTNYTGLINAGGYGDLNVIKVPTPNAPVITNNGTTGATSYSYKIVALSVLGSTPGSTAGTTTTGNATLSATNSNTITWEAVPGALSYNVYRSAGGSTQGIIGNVLATAALTLVDTGLTGDTTSAPTTNTTGVIRAGGTPVVSSSAPIFYTAPNYIATETGSNNAIAGALVDATGTNVPLAAGLRVLILLAHTLQAGANTFALNGTAKNLKSHLNPANNIATAYVSGSLVDMVYDGTQWQDMSQ